MSDTPEPDAPIVTAPAEAPAPVVSGQAVAQAVIQTVSDHPDIPADSKAAVAAQILASIEQAEPAIFAVSRASARTQTTVSIGVGLLEMLFGLFARH